MKWIRLIDDIDCTAELIRKIAETIDKCEVIPILDKEVLQEEILVLFGENRVQKEKLSVIITEEDIERWKELKREGMNTQ